MKHNIVYRSLGIFDDSMAATFKPYTFTLPHTHTRTNSFYAMTLVIETRSLEISPQSMHMKNACNVDARYAAANCKQINETKKKVPTATQPSEEEKKEGEKN